MLEKGRISAFQLGVMMYPTILATGFLALPTLTAQYADNDLWLAAIIASLSGIISIYAATRLHTLFPKQTVIQYSEQLLGKIAGKILGMVYFIFLSYIVGTTIRQYADFVTGNFLFKTPILVVISLMMLLCAFAVRGGVELLARSAVIFIPIFIMPIFLLLLLSPELDVKNIFPFLGHGITPVLKGSITPLAWVSEYFYISFFLPCLADPDKGRKWSVISMIAVIVSLTYVDLISLFLLGPDTGNKVYPILTAFRYISVTDFFENLESLLLAMWIVGNFVKICVFYYASVISFAQCFQISDYRPVVFPIGIFAIEFSFWDLPNFPQLALLLSTVSPFYLLILMTIIPMLLLLIAVIRKRTTAGKGEPAQ